MLNGHYTPEQVRLEIKKLIAIVTEREPEEVLDTASFKDELGLDSLMAMEVMISVDRKFKIDIPEDDFTRITNVDDAVETVMRYLPQPGVLSVP